MSNDKFCEQILFPRLGCSADDFFPIPVSCFLNPRIATVSNINKNAVKMSMSMKWRHLSYLQLLWSSAVSLMPGRAQKEAYPRDVMANSQGMKSFTVDRHGLR